MTDNIFITMKGTQSSMSIQSSFHGCEKALVSLSYSMRTCITSQCNLISPENLTTRIKVIKLWLIFIFKPHIFMKVYYFKIEKLNECIIPDSFHFQINWEVEKIVCFKHCTANYNNTIHTSKYFPSRHN